METSEIKKALKISNYGDWISSIALSLILVFSLLATIIVPVTNILYQVYVLNFSMVYLGLVIKGYAIGKIKAQ
jgi:hypothetical protein